MNKLNVLFKMSYIYSLEIISVVPQTHKMYDIDLKSTSPANYDFYIKNYYSSKDNILTITEVKSPHSDIPGFVCIHYNQTTNTYTKTYIAFQKILQESIRYFTNLILLLP